MQLRYNYRLDPTPGQIRDLARAFGCARWVYNAALAARKASYEAGDGWISGVVLSKRLITEAKQDTATAWLGEVSAVVLQQALRDNDTAYKNFFDSATGRRKGRPVGEPRFRSRRDHRQAIRFTANSRFKISESGRLSLPKIGDVKVRWSRPLASVPSSVTVIRDASGRYFASFVVVTDGTQDLDRFPNFGTELGIDLGLTHFAVLSDGTKVTSPKFLRKAEKKLKKLQQDLARKQKGSANRDKARVKLARQHSRVADSRRDFHHKLSTMLIRENQAVYVEDLCVSGLGRTRLAKSVHEIGRFEPSSQTCTNCWAIDGPKPLSIRDWSCPGCGAVHDRDVNAAMYILAAGRADRKNACGGQVRPGVIPAQADEAGTRRDDRTLA